MAAISSEAAQRRATTETERLAADSFLRAKIPARQDGEIWLFRNPNRHGDAFVGTLNRWLPHRLGLQLNVGQRRLTFGFRAANVQDCREPRFLDTTWMSLSYWDWRGRTRPVPGTPGRMNGFEEVVAEPPELQHLNRPVIRLTVDR